MTEIRTTLVSCNTCGSTSAREVGRSRDYEFHSCTNEFVFVECRECGVIYLQNRPDLAELRTIYPPAYYDYNEYLGTFVTWLRSLAQRGRITPIARYAAPGAFIVEVGCGNGELLRALKAYGDPSWRLMGIDFSSEACAFVERHGIDARCGRFEALEWHDRPPDVVIMNQVIEHLDDPRRCVRRARELLAPGGVLIVETPSTDAWDADWFRPRWWGGWHCPRHWNLYTPATLAGLFEREGLTVVETTFLLSPFIWCHSLQNLVGERLGWTRLARAFSERVVPTLVLVSALDVVQRWVHGRTSNMRMVGRRPTEGIGTEADIPHVGAP
ncbi:MAG: class I SAM-dependent methyltransferase [Vicinamibacterales bacterium]